MKIKFAALFVCPFLLSAPAQADFLAVKVQLDSWQASADGAFGQTGASVAQEFRSKNQLSLGLALEHPIPLLPNLAVRYQQLEHTGRVELAQTFALAGQSFAVGSQINSTLDLSQLDLVLYYELLDNNLIELDLGAMVKRINGKAAASNQASLGSEQSVKGNIPMLYAATRLNLVGTSWQFFAQASGVTPGRHQAHDVSAGLAFQWIDTMMMDGAIRLGYRDSKLELDNLQGLSTRMDYSGVFVGLELSF
ncbi:TIGR04219 family outer membrane beta-barrel protein [Alkalimonas sp. MEB108]|uniref:TIGR04219 family outer membrane beta-barrel protein n=1 Tax=Alkalimonas cellulosilytica TaxID=3058395 RepID=A0ABU7J3Z9_9GAMM|nr:TIGR04219 family outer membrane beta-barrel protein [Alkalimonas sp. MEB108]MEE2001129.1 TIGR04219 family outer membrane beta-barrel protein [Alkalimonas sp. MEB108]